jgi:hypothetical protein
MRLLMRDKEQTIDLKKYWKDSKNKLLPLTGRNAAYYVFYVKKDNKIDREAT